jgi:hypothetical protein
MSELLLALLLARQRFGITKVHGALFHAIPQGLLAFGNAKFYRSGWAYLASKLSKDKKGGVR